MLSLHFDTVGLLCSTVQPLGGQTLLDLTPVSEVDPFALMYLGMFIRRRAQNGERILVIPPKNNPILCTLLRKVRFLERFSRPTFVDSAETFFPCEQPTWFLADVEGEIDAGEKVARRFVRILDSLACGAPPGVGVMADVLSELVDNFATHSGQPLATFGVVWNPDRHRLSILVGDCGSGIRATLSANSEYAGLRCEPHSKAIIRAFEPLVSHRGEGGTGLTEVRNAVVTAGGSLLLASGDGGVIITREGRMYPTEMGFDLPGVQVEVRFPAA